MIRLLPDQGFELTYSHGTRIVIIWGYLSKTDNEYNVDVSPFESEYKHDVESETVEIRIYNADGDNITHKIIINCNDDFVVLNTNELPSLLLGLKRFDDDYGQTTAT